MLLQPSAPSAVKTCLRWLDPLPITSHGASYPNTELNGGVACVALQRLWLIEALQTCVAICFLSPAHLEIVARIGKGRDPGCLRHEQDCLACCVCVCAALMLEHGLAFVPSTPLC